MRRLIERLIEKQRQEREKRLLLLIEFWTNPEEFMRRFKDGNE